MLRFLVLVAALVTLPGLCRAEEVWRWRDASGQLHYSNIPSHVPADAEPVRTRLGQVSSTVPAPDAKQVQSDLAEYERLRQERMRSREESTRTRPPVGPYGMGARGWCCPSLGAQYVMIYNGHELADQVKQASLLDALGLPWRSGGCL